MFKAWTDKEHITKWFGPKGFACSTHEIDIRVDGRWRFEMRSPTLHLLGTSEAPRYLGLGGKRSDRVLPRQGA